MKVFLYERVSSEEQARHGYSLDAQHEALTKFCSANDHTIVGTYKDEGISARKPYTKRPAMLELLKDIETVKPDIILFTKLDRWFRNIKEYYKVQDILDKNGVYWKAINEEYDTSTASGRLYVNIKLSIAQDEADRTSERIKDVQGQLLAKGQVLCGKHPFGYKIENKRMVFDDDIEIVKDAIDHYLLHHSVIATVRYLNDKYKPIFNYNRVRRLLSNPIIKGSYRDNPTFCEPLISSEQFDKIQELLSRNVKSNTKRTYLFTGLIVCPVCGRYLDSCHQNYANYYRCRYHYYNLCTMKKFVREDKLEKWLLENVEQDFKVNVEMRPKEKKEDPQKYIDRLKRLNEIYILGNIYADEYKRQSAELQRKIAELQKSAPLKTQNFNANWQEVYAQLDDEHKRSFWRGLIKEIHTDVEISAFEIVY